MKINKSNSFFYIKNLFFSLILGINIQYAFSSDDLIKQEELSKTTPYFISPDLGIAVPGDLKNISAAQVIEKGISLLDKIYGDMNNLHNCEAELEFMSLRLNEIRLALSEADWRSFVHTAREHPTALLLRQDPLTKRAYEKPRGYAGDAVMLDYIYYGIPSSEILTPIGNAVVNVIQRSPAVIAVRNRAVMLGRIIDTMVKDKEKSVNKDVRILSVACGHARELSQSQAFMSNKLKEFVAFDQDKESLLVVQKDYSAYAKNITTIQGIISNLLKGKYASDLKEFDLVFSLGLFDYIKQPTAVKLTTLMFNCLQPGGRIIIGNFRTENNMRGYMECFMDWYLIHRSFMDMESLSVEIPSRQIAEKKIYTDSARIMWYLEIKKLPKLPSLVRAKL